MAAHIAEYEQRMLDQEKDFQSQLANAVEEFESHMTNAAQVRGHITRDLVHVKRDLTDATHI